MTSGSFRSVSRPAIAEKANQAPEGARQPVGSSFGPLRNVLRNQDPDRTCRVRYSITSSARASSEGGTSSPSALAVFRLINSSNVVGRMMGISAGFSPFRTRLT